MNNQLITNTRAGDLKVRGLRTPKLELLAKSF